MSTPPTTSASEAEEPINVKIEPVDAAEGSIISQPDSVPVIITDAEPQKDHVDMENDEKDIVNNMIICPDEVRKANEMVYKALRDIWTELEPSSKETGMMLATAHAGLTKWDEQLDRTPKYISFAVSAQNFKLMRSSINKIDRILEYGEDRERIKPKMLKDLEQETTALFKLYRQYGIQWREVTPIAESKKVIKYLFSADAPTLGDQREVLQLAFIEPAHSQALKVANMLNCLNPMMSSNDQQEYLQRSRELDELNMSIMEENINGYHDQAYICPPPLLYDALRAGATSMAMSKLTYHMLILGAAIDMPQLSDVDRQTVRLEALLGTGKPYSRQFLDFRISDRPNVSASPAWIPKSNQPRGKRAKSTDIDSDDESDETEDEAESDDDEPVLYTRGYTGYPKGSKTVAWGAGRSNFYINRIGPAIRGIYRIENSPIYTEDDDVKWDDPPRCLCVTERKNRKGEKTSSTTGKLKYTHIKEIYGVAFNADKTPFPKLPAYEAMNQENYDKANIERKKHGKTDEERKLLRFIGCYVRVGWLINGNTVKTWELRSALQASVRWKKDGGAKAIYMAVVEAETAHAAWLKNQVGINSRDPTPAYAEDIVKNLNGGSHMRIDTSTSPTPERSLTTPGRRSSTPGRRSPTPGRRSPTTSHYSLSPLVSSPRVTASPTSLTANEKMAEDLATELRGLEIGLMQRYLRNCGVRSEGDLTPDQLDLLTANALKIQRLAR